MLPNVYDLVEMMVFFIIFLSNSITQYVYKLTKPLLKTLLKLIKMLVKIIFIFLKNEHSHNIEQQSIIIPTH